MKVTIQQAEIQHAVAALLTKKGFPTTGDKITFGAEGDDLFAEVEVSVNLTGDVAAKAKEETAAPKVRKPRTPKVKPEAETEGTSEVALAEETPALSDMAELALGSADAGNDEELALAGGDEVEVAKTTTPRSLFNKKA